jgi:DNA-binding IclR family transcriptional regulator
MANTNEIDRSGVLSGPVKSAARVLEIFEFFDEVRRPATIHEVSAALGYPNSSTAALLKSLVTLGYLDHEPTQKTFFPSVRISLLGNWVEAETLPIRNLHRLMRHLSDETGCTVIMALRSGAYAQYVKVLQATTPIRFHVKPGVRRLLPFSTLGRVLLAALPKTKARGLIDDALERNSSAAKHSRKEIENDLEKIRRRGYAFYADLVTSNAAMLAAQVAESRTGEPVAVGIGAPKDHFRDRRPEFVKLLNEAIAKFVTNRTEGGAEMKALRSEFEDEF